MSNDDDFFDDFFDKSYQKAKSAGIVKCSKTAMLIMQNRSGAVWIHRDGRAIIGNGHTPSKLLPKHVFDVMLLKRMIHKETYGLSSNVDIYIH